MMNKIEIIEPVSGFTERESNSKALLNTDVDSLLKYKIQKRRFSEINRNVGEISKVKLEVEQIKNDLCEIKQLLLQITQK
jgi:hypothetical protein